MKTPIALIFLAVSAIVLGCDRKPTHITTAERRSIEAEVQAALDSLTAAWINLDARAVAAHYSDSSIDTYDGVRSSAYEINEWAETGYEDVSETEIGPFENLRFDVLARDAVVVSWTNTFVETDSEGRRLPKQLALVTQVWVREGKDWRILHSHETTRPAA